MKKLLKWLLLLMPACLFLSYHPVIKLGESETMYFELSVAEIWLVLFDIVAFVVMCQEKKLFSGSRRWWLWVLFPVWVTLSVIWSLNTPRGLLTAGLMWALVFAGYAIWSLRGLLDKKFREKWWKWLFGTTLVVCVWCVVQCILDLAGVPRECSLLCEGCTYQMFGFPHPNGFAIEPQFMGNLLLAPLFASVYYLLEKHNKRKLERERSRDGHFHNGSGGLALIFQYQLLVRDRCKNDNGSHSLCSRFLLLCFFIIAITLFLTFSRGAIYAFIVGLLFMSAFVVAREKKKRGMMWKRVGVVWGVTVGAFVVALLAQGVMAEMSPTSDTFGDGVSKVVNQLSLGLIKTRNSGGEPVENSVDEPVENSVEKTQDGLKGYAGEKSNKELDITPDGKTTAMFDGYVAESTDTRVRLSGSAVKIWSGDFKTALIGVGLGGAGQALYNNGLSPAPREIVQNEYASLLLETGLIGILLFILTVILVVRFVLKQKEGIGLVFSLLVAYGVTLCFFSGLPNALHIYLMPIILLTISLRKVKIKIN